MGELYNPYPTLPKNIRQIGERDQIMRLYVEDYVNTYLKRLFPSGGQDLRVGLLLGETREQDGVSFVFVDGAMEMEGITRDGEQVDFTESAWKEAYSTMEQAFPRRNVIGWFLCGLPGCTLSPLNYWKQHGQYFSGKNQIMYLNSGLEGEEVIYTASGDGFYKLRGYCVYYERNQMMQDYMVSRKDARRVESGNRDVVIRDFRQKLEDRRVEARRSKSKAGVLGTACAALSVIVAAGGVVSFNNYQKMKQMEAVIASVVPERYVEKPVGDEGELPVEYVPGEVYPTLAIKENDQGTVIQNPQSTESVQATESVQPAEPTQTSDADQTIQSQESVQPIVAEQLTEAAPVQVPADAVLYVVQSGETLYGICMERYQGLGNIEQICLWNGLEDENRISAGQEIYLPVS